MRVVSAKQAIAGLNALTLRASDALDGLSRLGARLEFCETVRQVRPSLYRQHQRDCFASPERFHALIEAFYQHLETLFPTVWHGLEEECYEDHALSYIEIFPQGEMWHEWDPEQIGLAVCGALVITGEVDPPRKLAGWKPRPGLWNEDKLAALCKKQRGPLRYAVQAVRYAFHDTGNLWLDTTVEMLEGSYLPEMSTADIRFWAAEWRKAERIFRQIKTLENWLEADPANRLPQLYRLYQQARVADADVNRVRVGVMSSADFVAGNRPLVETLPLDDNDDEHEEGGF